VVNSTFETAIAQRAVEKLLGRKGVAAMDHPSMGSEDFSYYLQQVPGCYVRFGACAEGCEHIPLHSPSFDFAEPVLKIGAAYFAQVVSEAIDAYRRRI
jgi:Metal-dependent amidase/aminoacylase/carboxypeptidase